LSRMPLRGEGIGEAENHEDEQLLPLVSSKLRDRPRGPSGQLGSVAYAAKRSAAVRQALAGVPVLPSETFHDLAHLRCTTTDWNLCLYSKKMFAEHLLKGRNTHVSLPSDFIKEFNITLADKAPVFFRHREAFIPYESLVTMAIVDETDKPRPISTEELLRYKKGEATDPLRGEANPLLEQLRSTETRFKAPYAKTYLTYENSGVYDRRVRTVVFHDIAGQPEGLLLPPDKRSSLTALCSSKKSHCHTGPIWLPS
jgi:hypothetical protein